MYVARPPVCTDQQLRILVPIHLAIQILYGFHKLSVLGMSDEGHPGGVQIGWRTGQNGAQEYVEGREL